MAAEDNESTEQQPRRQLRLRGRAGGFSGGTSTRSESLRTPEQEPERFEPDDEIDSIIDPDAMQRNIMRHTRAQSPDRDVPSPGDRMNQVNLSGSASYSKEYRMKLLHRMLVRRVPLDQIAKALGVSISTVEKDRAQLKHWLREQARGLNINEIVGEQLERYDEVAGMAIRIASASEGQGAQPPAVRLAAMRTFLAAEADKNRFLNSAGVFDAMTFRRGEDGSEVSDVQRLMERTSELMERVMASDAPPAAPPRRRKGGFDKFDLNDAAPDDDEGLLGV